jgi:CrcB protein
MTALLVALGAAVGAPLRFLLGHYLDDHFPKGTLLANLAGSFLLGVFSGLSLSGDAMAVLGIGFCGAFTTYSAFAVKVVERGRVSGTAYAVVTVFYALVACWLGFLIGRGL